MVEIMIVIVIVIVIVIMVMVVKIIVVVVAVSAAVVMIVMTADGQRAERDHGHHQAHRTGNSKTQTLLHRSLLLGSTVSKVRVCRQVQKSQDLRDPRKEYRTGAFRH